MASPEDLTVENGPLYAARKASTPRRSTARSGAFKLAIMFVTLAIYMERHGYAGPADLTPRSGVLVDLAHRRFSSVPNRDLAMNSIMSRACLSWRYRAVSSSPRRRARLVRLCLSANGLDRSLQHVDRLIDCDRNAQIRLANGPWTFESLANARSNMHLFGGRLLTGGGLDHVFCPMRHADRRFLTGRRRRQSPMAPSRSSPRRPSSSAASCSEQVCHL